MEIAARFFVGQPGNAGDHDGRFGTRSRVSTRVTGDVPGARRRSAALRLWVARVETRLE